MRRVYFESTAQVQNALNLSVILVIVWLMKYKIIYVQKNIPALVSKIYLTYFQQK